MYTAHFKSPTNFKSQVQPQSQDIPKMVRIPDSEIWNTTGLLVIKLAMSFFIIQYVYNKLIITSITGFLLR